MEEIEFIESKPKMALVATVVYNDIPLLYEWLPLEEAKIRLNQVLGKPDSPVISEPIEGDNSAI